MIDAKVITLAIGAAVLVGGPALAQDMLQGVAISPALTIFGQFVVIAFMVAKIIMDGRATREFRTNMKDVPDRLTRMETAMDIITKYIEAEQQDARAAAREREAEDRAELKRRGREL